MIEKLLAVVLVGSYVVWSFTAQNRVSLDEPTQQVSNTEKKHSTNIHLSQKKFHDIIVEAGEKSGWTMTKFKNNAIIAEKIDNEGSLAVTVKFDKSSFSIFPVNSELKKAISTMLEITQKEL